MRRDPSHFAQRRTDDPRWRRKNVGVMALGGLLILCGLATLMGLTPTLNPANEKWQHWIAAGLVAVGIPFLVFGDGPAAIGSIRSFLPGGKVRARRAAYESDEFVARSKYDGREGGGPG